MTSLTSLYPKASPRVADKVAQARAVSNTLSKFGKPVIRLTDGHVRYIVANSGPGRRKANP